MSFHIGFVVFANLTQLDFTGPLQVLHRLPGAKTHIIAKSYAPVASDCGLGLVPNATFADAPQLDLICVPGGFGVSDAIGDGATIDFVRRQAQRARYVSSVCTGAFVLGVAGLLRGRRATTHWAYAPLLALVGARHERARVVRDDNVFTGGGVTAGIDFALAIAAEVAGRAAAERVQLAIEYDPSPPFGSGDPERAPRAVRDALERSYAPRLATFHGALQRALAASDG
jgi:cyclohexyl-isocyanide hydratase